MLWQILIEAAGNLLAARQRSLLSLFGILIGSAAVIAMFNVGAIARNETVRQFVAMGTDVLTVQANSAGSNVPGLNRGDIESIPTVIPLVAEFAPLVTGGGSAVNGSVERYATFAGVSADFESVTRLKMQAGRFIFGPEKNALFCVIGAKLAGALSARGQPVRIGTRLRVNAYIFDVVGIIAPASQNPMLPLSVDDALFMSLPNARRLMPDQAIRRLAPNADAVQAARELETYFAARLPGGVRVETAEQLLAGMANQMDLFALLLGAVGAIALVLGGVGVMNIMLVSVSERRQEIGIRLAIGARRRDIQALFLAESVILAVAGGVLGIGLGLAASWGFARVSGWEFVVSPGAAPLGAGVSIVVGVFFGFYPAVSASLLDPIEALRAD